MKQTLKLVTLLLAIGLFTFSCKSDDDGGSGGSAVSGTITAKVDGTTVTTMKEVTFADLTNGMLSISGNTGGTNARIFAMNIVEFDGEGTYPISSDGNIFNSGSYQEMSIDINNPTGAESSIWQAPYAGGGAIGEIKVSKVTDTHIEGTFHFKAKNSEDGSIKNITDGSFNVDFMAY